MTSYKAVLEMGGEVVVRRLKDVVISENEFREKIEGVGAMDHANLVPLRAYYYSREEKLLVYDYMPMGSPSQTISNRLARFDSSPISRLGLSLNMPNRASSQTISDRMMRALSNRDLCSQP